MSWGPVPSQLCLLSDLPERAVGDKVRFLGCILSYDIKTACLRLGHKFPVDTDVIVSVNVELLLPTLDVEMTRMGQWVNIIGYIKENGKRTRSRQSSVHLQALLMWSTGPLDVEKYEASLGASTKLPL